MKEFEFQSEQLLPAPLERVFAFYSDAANLERITPPWLRFEIVTPSPVAMERGAVIDYRIRVRGLPMGWRSEITHWEPPYRFVDVQRRGPYRSWIHTHSFEQTDKGTIVRDHVRYAVPGGALVQKLFVAPDIQRIFSYRKERLAEIFAGPSQ